jgi:hypothetical protein
LRTTLFARGGSVWELGSMRGIATIAWLWVVTALLAGPAAAQNSFGAIAYSPGSGAHGWSVDYATREVAESTALRNCHQHADDCTVPIWFRNACGALAVGSQGYGSGWGTDRRIAERYALRSCRKHTANCAIRRWVCTSRR